MPAGSRTPQAGETRKALLFAARDPEFCEAARKLRTGAQAKLSVRMSQRLLDCVHAHEQLGGNLAIRLSFRDELCDTALARRQLIACRAATADPRKLGLSPRRPKGAPHTDRKERWLPERLPCGSHLPCPAMDLSGDEKRASALEGL